MRRTLLIALACTLLLGCRREPLPQGIQTVSGLLERADISLIRRGTHELLHNGKVVLYVESSVVPLAEYEGEEVDLRGTFEENADVRDLPVFVVTEILGGHEEATRAWSIPALGISLQVPRSWTGEINGPRASFTASGELLPMLRVVREGVSALPFDFHGLASSGTAIRLTPIVIGNRKAVSVENVERRTFTVYIDLPASSLKAEQVLVLSFRLPMEGDGVRERERFLTVVRSVQFSASLSSPARSPSRGSGSTVGDGKPCGGPAGVLCPPGYSCQVTDTVTDIGVCRKI